MAARIGSTALIAATALLAAAGQGAIAQALNAGTTNNAADELAIREVLSRYQGALNASSSDAAVSLYAEDAVLMAPNGPSMIGKAALQQAYDAGSKALQFKVSFTVAEVVEMSPEWAFARTNSAGSLTIKATGIQTAEANQELFILRKGLDGNWKIARYSFSSTKPPLS